MQKFVVFTYSEKEGFRIPCFEATEKEARIAAKTYAIEAGDGRPVPIYQLIGEAVVEATYRPAGDAPKEQKREHMSDIAALGWVKAAGGTFGTTELESLPGFGPARAKKWIDRMLIRGDIRREAPGCYTADPAEEPEG